MPFQESNVEGWLENLLQDFLLKSSSLIEKVAETENRIATAAEIDARDVILVLPDPKASEEITAGLDIKILTRAGGSYSAVPLMNEEDDSSPSSLLRRRKYVPSDVVQRDPEEAREPR